jgi:hypothetical protein
MTRRTSIIMVITTGTLTLAGCGSDAGASDPPTIDFT